MRIGIQTWGNGGIIRPFLALASGLSSAGHVVTLVTTGRIADRYQTIADTHGFELRTINPGATQGSDTLFAGKLMRKCLRTTRPIKHRRLVVNNQLTPFLDAMFEVSRELCADNDLVVGHFLCHPLLAAAELMNVPVATVMLAHDLIPSAHTTPYGFPRLGERFNTYAWGSVRRSLNRIFLNDVNTFRNRYGLPQAQDMLNDVWTSRELNLVAVSPTLAQPAEDWDNRHVICGFLDLPISLEQPAPPHLAPFLHAGEPPVYCSFGSLLGVGKPGSRKIATMLANAAQKANSRVIIHAPHEATAHLLHNEMLCCVEHAPHRAVLPHCCAMVHHGGSGHAQAALMAGLPSVIVPHVADQFFWAQVLRRLGASGAPIPRQQMRIKVLTRALRQSLRNDAMRNNAGRIGRRMVRENGVARAVEIIEHWFATGKA